MNNKESFVLTFDSRGNAMIWYNENMKVFVPKGNLVKVTGRTVTFRPEEGVTYERKSWMETFHGAVSKTTAKISFLTFQDDNDCDVVTMILDIDTTTKIEERE